jgi:hypothetical protein
MRDCSQLNDLGRAEIDALQADGIALTPAEIVKISWLAWQVETPEHRMLSARGRPVFVGGITLWPLTARGADWFREVALKLPDSLHEQALAYAMAYGRDDGTALDLTGREAEKAVKGWFRGLRATRRELTEALSQIIAQSEGDEMPPTADAPGEMSAGNMSAFLCAAAGGTPEMWERQVSSAYVLEMFRAVIKQNQADDRPATGDPRIEATKALAWYVHQIRESRKVATNG